ncbi:MAG: hypothetical protein WCC04_05735 [Terriglobales bacterium]
MSKSTAKRKQFDTVIEHLDRTIEKLDLQGDHKAADAVDDVAWIITARYVDEMLREALKSQAS